MLTFEFSRFTRKHIQKQSPQRLREERLGKRVNLNFDMIGTEDRFKVGCWNWRPLRAIPIEVVG